MRKVREFEDKKKASFFYNYVTKVSTECAMYLDATTGKYVVTWKWDKKAFQK